MSVRALTTRSLLALIVTLGTVAPVSAQRRTDVVEFANGDRITCEIQRLNLGKLQVRTDNLGTIDITWDTVVRLIASRLFEVETNDGRRFLGSFASADAGKVALTDGQTVVTLDLIAIVRIAPIGRNFWQQLDGHLDLGFTYTRSSGVAQLNIDYQTLWRRPAFTATLDFESSLTRETDKEETSRSVLGLAYIRRRGERWLVGGFSQFERSRNQGINLRASGAFVVGRLLVTTSRVESIFAGGVNLNQEFTVDGGTQTTVEGLLVYGLSYFTYHFPKTGFDISMRLYPALNDPGRVRFQLNTDLRRELFRDFTVSLNVFDSFDSRPPTEDALRNDIGIVTSIGWIF